MLGPLEGHLHPPLADGALHTQDNLFGGFSLQNKNQTDKHQTRADFSSLIHSTAEKHFLFQRPDRQVSNQPTPIKHSVLGEFIFQEIISEGSEIGSKIRTQRPGPQNRVGLRG